ncbi:hypothetical protein GA0074694_0929 [Micromonospora inyonensis]|uniref:Uncharacterized protein n=2 Tax=Micromonospora inyonensis TaxID=47866 RepID=A0A1C6RCE0_9ACTN|nr:hypothetical protein [Micromonospora inyonensis]SCL14819.1 hypothetical protein GA0074694_0929 [Micromonospora inyonensis]
MTEVRSTPTQRVAPEEPPPSDPVAAAWTDYLAAARQLDGVRRGAATAAGEQARSVQAAREELTVVRARLAAQQSRLRERGVPTMALVPSPPEVTVAARSMAAGPAAVLTALRTAREYADAADGVLDARGWVAVVGVWRASRPEGWPDRLRNLLVYGPVAVLGPLLQVVLVLTGSGARIALAVLLGLVLPAVAFAVGWVGVGRFFRPGPDGRLDRTPRFGVLVCGVPAALCTAGILVAVLTG